MTSSLSKVCWVVVLASALAALPACEEIIQETLDNPTTALAESDLPNCSRVTNCCTRLGQNPYAAVVPENVSTMCDNTVGSAAGTVIDNYQSAESAINNQSGITDERRSELLSDLRTNWQNAVEPGCRCFLEQTVGTIPDLVVPNDCESYTTTGALAGGATCDDGVSALIDTAANGLSSQ